MRTTQQVRDAWAPACSPKGTVFLAAYAALDHCLKAHRYSPRRADTGAYNCRRITGGTGYSLHSYGPGAPFTFWNGVTIATSLAVDINWQTNPYGPVLRTDMPAAMVRDIEAVRTVDGVEVWRWGGRYSGNKDAMHWEIVASPVELARGIVNTTRPEEFTMDAEAKQAFADLAARLKDLRARIEVLEKDRFEPTTRRVRELHDKLV